MGRWGGIFQGARITISKVLECCYVEEGLSCPVSFQGVLLQLNLGLLAVKLLEGEGGVF
jgi:hypothetical protein